MLKPAGQMGACVTRPNYVKVRALNEKVEEVNWKAKVSAEHSVMRSIILQDNMYVERVEDGLHDVEPPEEEVE